MYENGLCLQRTNLKYLSEQVDVSQSRASKPRRVLIIGANGIGSDLAQTLLSSNVIRSLTLMDNRNVTKEDLQNIFFIKPSSLGSNRAAACVRGIQHFNHCCIVHADKDDPNDKPFEYYKAFDIIVMTDQTFSDIIYMNEICHMYKKRFFIADVIGTLGFFFMDSIIHQDDNYLSFKSVANGDDRFLKLVLQREPNDHQYFLFKVYMDFMKQYKRKPSWEAEDKENLLKIRDSVLKNFNLPEDYLPVDYINCDCPQTLPAYKTMAGTLSENILQIVDMGYQYYIRFFDTKCICGTVYHSEHKKILK